MVDGINVNEVKKFLDYITNKEQSGNTLKPDQYNTLLRRATDELWNELYGVWQDYDKGRPIAKVHYEVTQLVKDFLGVFKEDDIEMTVDSEGKMTKPSDYCHYTRATYIYIKNDLKNKKVIKKRIKVEFIDDDKWDDRVEHPVKKVSKKLVIANVCSTYIQFEPRDIGKVLFTYLRYPKEPKWGYNITNDVAVYDPSSSVNVEFPEILTNHFTRLILSYIGINLREDQLLKYAEAIKTKGT